MTTRPLTPVKLLAEGGVRKVAGQAAAQAVAHGQDLSEPNPFAPLRQNNEVRCFTTGNDYFKAVVAAMEGAKKSIFIAGWQVNWDVELAPGKRLIDILHERIHSSESFRVYVMPWLSPKIGLNTFDLETMLAIFQLNAGRKTMQAMCCPSGPQSDFIGTEGAAFSHHQKLVVVDNEIAFIGGIDLAYGRSDDNKFSLNPGARRFQERYNPGVPGSQTVDPSMGACLTMMDLLKTTLTAGKWNSGGNSAPGAVSQYIDSRMEDAKKLALGAVGLVNKGAKLRLDANKALIDAGASGLRAGASGLKAGANAGVDVVVASAKAVSNSCATSQLPDFFGGLKLDNIGSAPTSTLPNRIRNFETETVKETNEAIATVAGLADFLAPLNRLQMRPDSHSIVAGTLEGGERLGRSGLNTVIDVEAALAGSAQEISEKGKQVCVQIGPEVERGVVQGKDAIRRGADQAATAVHNAQVAVNAKINSYQAEIIDHINLIRSVIVDKYFSIVALGERTLEEAISGMSQADLQKILSQLMRFAKLIYAAQVAIVWIEAAAHPLLLKKGTKAATGSVLGRGQPRQPWQDVQCAIKGPAVYDVAMNFIDRWNAAQKSYLSEQTLKDLGPEIRQLFESKPGVLNKALLMPAHLVPARPSQEKEPPSRVAVRVLRSAPLKMCQQEAKARGDKIIPQLAQSEIHTQMVNLIRGATDFIYIENQFFQTGFGVPSIDITSKAGQAMISGPMQLMKTSRMNRLKSELSSAGKAGGKYLLPVNDIGRVLGERIAQAVRRDKPFHVYLVLPVHPEGRLDDITIVGQIHWTMQSLVFADHSLINLIRRAIAARRLCKTPLSESAWTKAIEEAGATGSGVPPYQKIEEHEWSKYLSLLNLRTCEKVDGIVRTEQVYIHSKLLIVDDRHILMGSANINDRSQSGKRDSEIAVMLLDSAKKIATIRDRPTHVNSLARKLRTDLWNKHFAITGSNSIVKAAEEMAAFIEKPAAAATIKAIQSLAETNSKIYNEHFPHIAWSQADSKVGEYTGSSIWPVCPRGARQDVVAESAKRMPFHEDFWLLPAKPVVSPVGIRGFFTKLPTYWTKDENNHPSSMSVMALTMNEGSTRPGRPGFKDDNDIQNA